jgi:nicotinamide-nucleotide amidase
MKAEIISIGTEMITGRNLDTNSQWLSRRLAALGVPVRFHTTLADDFEENLAALRVARGRASLIFITGGLGPTQDDLTREVLAALAGVKLELHQPSLDQIREMFASRRREMPERNQLQAMFPVGSEPLPNRRGTAPGIWFDLGDCLIVAMPGVPREMYGMFDEEVLPRLRRYLRHTGEVLLERKLNTFGQGESAVEAQLLDLTRRGHDPEVGITVSEGIISLRIFGRGKSEAEAQAHIAPVEAIIRERLGDAVFGVDDEELHEVVAKLLLEQRRSVAVAESLTGGLVTSLLARVPGISASLLGGLVAYANDAKIRLLGVPAETLQEHGAVSAPVAEAMAEGVRQRFGADLAVSTTGIAGPGGGTPSKPIGLVYIGLASKDGVRSWRVDWFGSRQEIQLRSALSALNALRLKLLGRY